MVTNPAGTWPALDGIRQRIPSTRISGEPNDLRFNSTDGTKRRPYRLNHLTTSAEPPREQHTGELIRALTVVGMLTYGGWVLWFFQVVQRASRIGASRFASAWEQKIEALSFISFPPNIPVLASAAAAAALATWLAGPTQDIVLAILLRVIRWSANAVTVVAVLSVIAVIVGEAEGPDRFGTIAFRAGGALCAAAVSYLCLTVGRTAPGG